MPGPGRPPTPDEKVRKQLKNARYQLNVLRRALSSWKAAALAWRELAEDVVNDAEGTKHEQDARREFGRGEEDARAARGHEEAAAKARADAKDADDAAHADPGPHEPGHQPE